ncbi:putative quinol monooxygenase [Bdellovibrio sp. NC01]|uniref:putative quinol monooxygenase n=1 Tax=Bdellovibrio sp. NC01 TaxID=2220073 RepID=UPI00115AF3C6|nr:putative quinol monooxygenase [Bdellovibrio sp. NC01]QDK38745.1 antibiotic biosynthesis monooxygenase [Bdellovibrio sp. NC01]
MVIVARWIVQVQHLNTVLGLLKELQVHSRQEPASRCYDFYQDPAAPEKILIYEEYNDEEGIEAHRMSPHFQSIIPKILPMLKDRSVQVFEQR